MAVHKLQKIREIPWVRIGAESAAIIASILLAFAIDAWWAERIDRRAQNAILSGLHEEFSAIREQLEEEDQELIYAAVTELYQIASEHADRTQPLEVPNSLLRAAIATGNVDLATPVLDGIVLSGGLERIGPNRLASVIAGWQLASSEISDVELRALEVAESVLIPALTRRGNMGEVLVGANRDGKTSILIDDELEGLLGMRHLATRRVVPRLERLKTSVDEVLSAIEEAQGLSAGTQ